MKVKVLPHCKEIAPLYSEHRSNSTQRHLEYADKGKYVQYWAWQYLGRKDIFCNTNIIQHFRFHIIR